MKKGYLLVLLTALVSGVSIFLNKFAVTGIDPYIFTFSKNILVALLLISLIMFFKEYDTIKRLTKKQWGQLVMIGFFGGSVPFLLFFKGLSMAPSATAALLHKSMFIFVAVLAVLFLKEKLNKWAIIAVALLFGGNLLLLNTASLNSLGFGSAELLILIAVMFWSIETIISKQVLAEIPSRVVAAGRMFFGVLFIAAFLVFKGEISGLVAMTSAQIGWVLLTSALLLAYVTSWYAGLKIIPASQAACVLLLGSAITTLLDFAYSGMITLTGLAGAASVSLGVILIIGYSNNISRNKDPSPDRSCL